MVVGIFSIENGWRIVRDAYFLVAFDGHSIQAALDKLVHWNNIPRLLVTSICTSPWAYKKAVRASWGDTARQNYKYILHASLMASQFVDIMYAFIIHAEAFELMYDV